MLVALVGLVVPAGRLEAQQASWQPCGWGGGGYFWCAAYDPAKAGVIYMGGDVAGVYKSEDNGRSWHMINTGLTNYGVYSLAVDRMSPQTVYAATEGGLYKSVDGGDHWQFLPLTGPSDLHVTAERDRSVRAVAVDPTNSSIVYAASPAGMVYKSVDGAQTWKIAYQKPAPASEFAGLRAQFGKESGEYFGGFWLPLTVPASIKSADCVGIGISFQGDGSTLQNFFLTVKTTAGVSYRSKDLHGIFKSDQAQDVVLSGVDFVLDPDFAKSHPDLAKTVPATPDWPTVNRMDLVAVGDLPASASVGKFGRIFLSVTRTPDGRTAPADKPINITLRAFTAKDSVPTYGNIRLGSAKPATVYSVAVSQKDPKIVVAATADTGLVISRDGGQTWTAASSPKMASSVAISPTDPEVMYASFFTDGIWKSGDEGKTWANVSQGLGKGSSIREVDVSGTNPRDVYAIGTVGWNGAFYASHDGGITWKQHSSMAGDPVGIPTLPGDNAVTAGLSASTNLAISPVNPKDMFISANWSPCVSHDAGATWVQSGRGADISCITDIEFHNGRVFATAMDEGTLVSDNDGSSWHQLWPLKFDDSLSGHNWRVAVTGPASSERIISTVSPWNTKYPDRTVLSTDGGKTYKTVTAGLPDYLVQPNTMWGVGHPRALAVDPNDPDVVYLGIDGDPADGKSGGGIFKSVDGGATWRQLPNQPGSRRMFYGLAVDPTDSQRMFWGACGDNGGLWRTEDGGATWSYVFKSEQWIFNVLVDKNGVVYCPGKNLWRSTDHGATWAQLTHFNSGKQLMGLEVDPRDSKTIWVSSDAGVFKTTDNGVSWQDITGNLPYTQPEVLRFDPGTNELWAGWVGLYKIKQ